MAIFIPIILGILVYSNTLQNSFHYDDAITILDKPWVRGLDKIPDFIFSFGSRPLLILTWNLNYAISGFEVWSWHLVNIALHLLNVFFIYRLVSRATDNRIAPFVASLVFSIHPLNTEAVTYISSRSSVLSTTFYLSVVLFCEKPLVAGILFFLGYMVKETIITAPVIAALYHFYFVYLGKPRDWAVKAIKSATFAGLGVLGLFLAMWLNGKSLLPGGQTNYTWFEYAIKEPSVILLYYFHKMLLPIGLSIDVDYSRGVHFTEFVACFITLYIAVPMYVSRLERKNRLIGFGLAWMVISLIPTSSIIPLLDLVAERHAYLPLVGFSIVLGRIMQDYASWKWGLFIAYIAVLCFLTMERNAVWKDDVSLWKDASGKYPLLTRPHNNLGEAYDVLGNYDEAIKEFNIALKINPAHVFAINNLGNIYGKKNEVQKAIPYFELALSIDPTHATANYNLGLAYQKIQRFNEAYQLYERAIKYNPYMDAAWKNKIILLNALGMKAKAVEELSRYKQIRPDADLQL